MPFISPAQEQLDELNQQMENVAKGDNLIKLGHRAVEYGRHLKAQARQRCREIELGMRILLDGHACAYT